MTNKGGGITARCNSQQDGKPAKTDIRRRRKRTWRSQTRVAHTRGRREKAARAWAGAAIRHMRAHAACAASFISVTLLAALWRQASTRIKHAQRAAWRGAFVIVRRISIKLAPARCATKRGAHGSSGGIDLRTPVYRAACAAIVASSVARHGARSIGLLVKHSFVNAWRAAASWRCCAGAC